jgi:AcrR family transcriptional regulator
MIEIIIISKESRKNNYHLLVYMETDRRIPMQTPSTKERIMDAAIRLFSDTGYDAVSMRDIAAEVGIKAASIYNHFPSKRDILKKIFEFYITEHRRVIPDLEELLYLLETQPIHDVAQKTVYYWPPIIQDKMDRILLIAGQRISMDRDSEAFLRDHFFKSLMDTLVPLVNRAVELGKIEPIDVDCFCNVAIYYAFSAAELNRTAMKISKEQWKKGIDMIYSLLKPVKG